MGVEDLQVKNLMKSLSEKKSSSSGVKKSKRKFLPSQQSFFSKKKIEGRVASKGVNANRKKSLTTIAKK